MRNNTYFYFTRFFLQCICLTISFLLASAASAAACRVTDFTDRPLASLNKLQQLSLLSRMTQTEFDKFKEAGPGDDNYHPIVASNESFTKARQAAWSELESLDILNFDEFRIIWASDFLEQDQLENFLNCISSREPGLIVAGRHESDSEFRITFTHITPIGIRQIATRLEASHNISNIGEFEDFLNDIGFQDNYTAKSFLLKKTDPEKRAVLLLRAGWETPDLIYIPVYPTSVYLD